MIYLIFYTFYMVKKIMYFILWLLYFHMFQYSQNILFKYYIFHNTLINLCLAMQYVIIDLSYHWFR